MTETQPAAASSMTLSLPGRVLVAFGGVASAFGGLGLTPVLPAIAAHFAHVSRAESLTRALVSVIALVAVVVSPFVGMAADRFGLRRLMIVGHCIYGSAGLACFSADNLYILLVLRVIVGLGAVGVGVATLALIATRISEASRNAWMGYVTTFSTLGTLLLIPVAGHLGTYGWRWAFLTHLFSVPFIILAFVGLDPDRKVSAAKTASGTSATVKIPVLMTLIAATAGIVTGTSAIYVPFHLRDIGVSDPDRIGSAMVPMVLVLPAVAFLYGRIRSYLSLGAAFAAGFLVVAVGLSMDAAAQTFAPVMVGQCILAAGAGLLAPSVFAQAANTGADSQKASMMGDARAGFVGGPMLGQLVIEPVVTRSDSSVGLFTLATAAVALALAHGWNARARAMSGGLEPR
jgi:MFS family permease